jgi:hypothetical protein
VNQLLRDTKRPVIILMDNAEGSALRNVMVPQATATIGASVA